MRAIERIPVSIASVFLHDGERAADHQHEADDLRRLHETLDGRLHQRDEALRRALDIVERGRVDELLAAHEVRLVLPAGDEPRRQRDQREDREQQHEGIGNS
jgi:hypothetical protein